MAKTAVEIAKEWVTQGKLDVEFRVFAHVVENVKPDPKVNVALTREEIRSCFESLLPVFMLTLRPVRDIRDFRKKLLRLFREEKDLIIEHCLSNIEMRKLSEKEQLARALRFVENIIWQENIKRPEDV